MVCVWGRFLICHSYLMKVCVCFRLLEKLLSLNRNVRIIIIAWHQLKATLPLRGVPLTDCRLAVLLPHTQIQESTVHPHPHSSQPHLSRWDALSWCAHCVRMSWSPPQKNAVCVCYIHKFQRCCIHLSSCWRAAKMENCVFKLESWNKQVMIPVCRSGLHQFKIWRHSSAPGEPFNYNKGNKLQPVELKLPLHSN